MFVILGIVIGIGLALYVLETKGDRRVLPPGEWLCYQPRTRNFKHVMP
jgi:hypothetical protein